MFTEHENNDVGKKKKPLIILNIYAGAYKRFWQIVTDMKTFLKQKNSFIKRVPQVLIQILRNAILKFTALI